MIQAFTQQLGLSRVARRLQTELSVDRVAVPFAGQPHYVAHNVFFAPR